MIAPNTALQRVRWYWLKRAGGPALALGACIVTLFAAQRLSPDLDYHGVIKTLRQMSPNALVRASLAAVISYLALVARDAVALRTLGIALPRPLLWVGATAGSALGNAVGFGALTGAAVRYRVYGAAGIGASQIARLTALTTATFGLGLVVLSAVGLIAATASIARMLDFRPQWLLAAGVAILASVVAGLVLLRRVRGSRLRIGPWTLSLPSYRGVAAQLALVAIDVVAAGLTLYALLPAGHVGVIDFLAVYTIGLSAGVIGHTPGGIGIFEAAILFALDGSAKPVAVVAALLAYRAIYFILPLLLSAALLAAFEVRGVARRLAPPGMTAAAPRIASLVPLFLGVITFASGIMLLISGATPAFGKRLAILQTTLPLWVIEGSQLAGSVLGVMLLFVARGLMRRLDAAWWLATVIAAISLLLSLAKGLAFVEAGVLGFVVALLIATRDRFDRRASLFEERFTLSWMISIGIVLAVAVWVLFFAFRDVPYSRELWWQFEFDEKASRALRATLGAGVFAAAMALWQLLRPASGRRVPPTTDEMREAAAIVRRQERSSAVLAMMGDKSFVFSASRRSFLMYSKRGRSWVALHDPIGPPEEAAELIGRFVALAAAHGGRAAFYQVRPDALPLYLEAGLKLMKLGEEATIRLPNFVLEGSHRTRLRYALKRGERDGLSADLHGPADIATVMPVLHAISDAWVERRRAREKGFSVAGFQLDYLAAQSVMIVRQNGHAIAFATFMTTDLATEVTVGVMRHTPSASPYAMEYLFVKLALFLKEAGYERLSLGMAPLSGLTPAPLAGPWHRMAYLVWRFGGLFYNFRGLRSFKGKFDPDWQPRYLAASGMFGPFLTLADLFVLAESRS